MRITTALLFVMGSYFSIFAWVFTILPFAVLREKNNPFLGLYFLYFLIVSATFIAGYYIWFSWGFYTIKKRVPILSNKKFGLLSLFQCISAFIFFCLLSFEGHSGKSFIENILTNWLNIWLLANLAVSILFMRLPDNAKMNSDQILQDNVS